MLSLIVAAVLCVVRVCVRVHTHAGDIGNVHVSTADEGWS